MTPEAKARLQIDQKLEQAGWIVQDFKQINLGAGLGVAVRGCCRAWVLPCVSVAVRECCRA